MTAPVARLLLNIANRRRDGRTTRQTAGKRVMRLKTLLLSATLFAAAIGGASAHTAFVVPRDFTPDTDYASAEASFTTQFFTPQIGLGADGFHAVRPNAT